MSRLSVCLFPDPVLQKPAVPVGEVDASVKRLVRQMLETMQSYPHCVGLAAPQIGRSLRIAVMDPGRNPKIKHSCGRLVLINPEILSGEDWALKREGCLSVPDLTANVRRALRIHLKAQDSEGTPYEIRLEGFDAHVAQHEVDHLNGKLFLDRVSNLKTDVFRRKHYR